MRYLEPIAKLALEAKFDDFDMGLIFCKLTYSTESRRLAENRIQCQKRGFGPKWSFAIGSLLYLFMITSQMAATEFQKERLAGLLTSLVSMPTESANVQENKNALLWVEKELPKGLTCQHYTFNGHPSLVVTTKETMSPDLFLVAHIDVVPAAVELFQPRREGDRLMGRGVYDMKMAIACYLLLFEELKETLSSMNIGLMFTSDEEVGGMNGVKALLELGYRAQVAFLPDGGFNWNIEEGAKGVLHVKIAAKGLSAHGARPWMGENAIEILMSALGKVRDHFEEKKVQFAPLYPTANIGIIAGGQGVNLVPDYAEAKIDIRYPPDLEGGQMFSDLQGLLAADPRVVVEVIAKGSAHKVDPGCAPLALFQRIAKEKYGIDVGKTFSHGSSDARFFGEKQIPTLVIAPLGGDIHGDSEWIDLEDLTRFYHVMKDWVIHLTQEV